MIAKAIICERRSSTAVIRLNRPNTLNALSRELTAQLFQELTRLERESDLRAVILTGEGRAFCAGTDINELFQLDSDQAVEASRRGQDLCNKIEGFPVPVIGAINGVVAGGGCELALACHLRIASTEAVFSLPETKLGVIPGYGGTQRLAREIGEGRALEMMLTGKTLTAEEAHRIGLINRISAAATLMAHAESLADEIAQLAPLAIRACLEAVVRGLELPLDQGLALETELFAKLFASNDVREGTRAFLEKRKPLFNGT